MFDYIFAFWEPHAQSLSCSEMWNETNQFQVHHQRLEDIIIQFRKLVWLTEYLLKKWSWTSISLNKVIQYNKRRYNVI